LEVVVENGKPDIASDPLRAIRYATKRARRWFLQHQKTKHLNGMDADDIAQEALLSLLRNNADFRYAWNKTGFIITDQLRTHTGCRWREKKNRVDMQGSEIITSVKPAKTDRDPVKVERIAVELVESSDLPEIVKRIAIMRMQGKSFKTISCSLGMSEAAMTYYTVAYARRLHDLASLPIPDDLLRRVERREEFQKNRRGQLPSASRRVKPDASSSPTSPSS
jgi:DNA-directed RNA polymerase specialized sigma24 family protein